MGADVWQWVYRGSGASLLIAIVALLVLPHTPENVYFFGTLGAGSAAAGWLAVRRTRDLEQTHALADADRLHEQLTKGAEADHSDDE